MANDINNTAQSAATIINLIAQSQRTGRELTISDNGKIGVASFGTHIAIKWNAFRNGGDWKAQRDTQINKDVLEHLTVAIEDELHTASASKKELSAWSNISSKLTNEFAMEFRQGHMPAAATLLNMLHDGLAKGLNAFTKDADAAAVATFNEWSTGNLKDETKKTLEQIKTGNQNHYDKLGELTSAHERLADKVDAMKLAYQRNPNPSDEEAMMLANYENALAKFTIAIDEAKASYREIVAANKGYAPERTTVAVVKPHVRVKFAGEGEGDGWVKPADDISRGYVGKSKGVLLSEGDRETLRARTEQPKEETAGVWNGNKERSHADIAAANAAWENYGKQDSFEDSFRSRSASLESI